MELLSLLLGSIRASWKKYLGVMIAFAGVAFAINFFLVQYNSLIQNLLSDNLPAVFAMVNPVVSFLQLDMALEYTNLVSAAALWLLLGFFLAVRREQGLRGVLRLPASLLYSARDVVATGPPAALFLILFTIITFFAGLYFNNILLLLVCIVTVLYALSARQKGVLIMFLWLLFSDSKRLLGDPTRSRDTGDTPIGFPVASVLGIWLGFFAALLYLVFL
ncbi:MAG: hypothetical protein D5R99_04735 [Methanocalculus sp. MSAO_Arc1]|uniref:hypothetical protein n=1 Tax=Methanocalculus sp. MSAO_Arc1 TaxID=2293854 RepID=UPI000FF22F1F|nr:hypothetical protein [Methanocalculus sp. MSAO_Arc1]RQD80516.1 MAG: hypothetical protein D5R99_04735 [Methanocalculus sp. MSAO_Arc1]